MRLRIAVGTMVTGFGGLYLLNCMDYQDAWEILAIYLALGALCWIVIAAGAIAAIRG